MNLKPCPCGKTPTALTVTDGSTFRWRYVSGGCCGWMIEARVNTMRPLNEQLDYEECVKAWNEQDRA